MTVTRTERAELQELKRDEEWLVQTTKEVESKMRDRITIVAEDVNGNKFTLPEVPAAVQEAGDQAFAQSANGALSVGIANLPPGHEPRNLKARAPRSDKGTKRPKPQPEPAPEQKAGGITQQEATELSRLISWEMDCLTVLTRAERMMNEAKAARIFFTDSLAK